MNLIYINNFLDSFDVENTKLHEKVEILNKVIDTCEHEQSNLNIGLHRNGNSRPNSL